MRKEKKNRQPRISRQINQMDSTIEQLSTSISDDYVAVRLLNTEASVRARLGFANSVHNTLNTINLWYHPNEYYVVDIHITAQNWK